MTIPFLLVGIVLLLWGRKLFWLLLGAIGFLFGWYLASTYFDAEPHTVLWLVAGASGIICAMLAIFLQKVAVAVAGFAGGGFVLANVAGTLQSREDHFSWIIFAVGGIGGAILAAFLFEWALIILSTITGAYLIVREFHTTPQNMVIAVVVLTLVGILFQTRKRDGRRPASQKGDS